MYSDEKACEEWKKAFIPCRMVSVEVERDHEIVLRDQVGNKPPCSNFNQAVGDAYGAMIYLDQKDGKKASSYWSVLKKAMIESVAQDVEIVNEKISELMKELDELKDERAKLKTTLADVRKLKIK